jgi:4-alpha-glucanotransferase
MKVVGSSPELGNWELETAPSMTYLPGDVWELQLEIPDRKKVDLTYTYCLQDESSGALIWEWGENRSLKLKAGQAEEVLIRDFWRPAAIPENAWHSAAFTENLMKREVKKRPRRSPKGATHRFQLNAPRVGRDFGICILGSDPALGAWDEEKAVLMDDFHYPCFQTDVVLEHPDEPVAYKYAVYDLKEKKVVTWEGGDNRVQLPAPATEKNAFVLCADEQFRYPVGNWKGAGVALPVFSLRSKEGMGVGEFNDLKGLIDWAEKTHLKLVQILPINDTSATHTWVDSYPYAAISVFALHPMYVNVEKMGKLKDKKVTKALKEEKERLNALPEVDYEAVNQGKWRYIRALYEQEGAAVLKSEAFQTFFEENQAWLKPYAAFCYLRDQHGTADFSQWEDFKEYDAEKIDELLEKQAEACGIHYYVQYHLFQQLDEVAAYARSKGVVLKGDIPIGIYRHSVDAWVAPHLYNMNAQAGAPPDAFAVAGQNWGFPTYNWSVMAEDNYSWWRRRLQAMARFFDAYRIDHILGFFRIWEIPYESVEGLLGHFNPALPMGIDEIRQWVGWFDYERFCQPYIREHMLADYFGGHAEEVRWEYLDEVRPGQYQLKPEVNTQRKVDAYFSIPADSDELTRQKLEKIKKGLMALVGEVLFLEAPFSDGKAFNPRISMHHTRSFQELDPGTRSRLDSLYIHYFYHRHEGFWREQAMTKLPPITEATRMLVCGEDLGMVPDSVPGVMNELGLLSLEIQRMPKATGKSFGHPADAPYLSVVSPGSHDMATLRGWWEEDGALTQQFYNEMLGHGGEAPAFCEPWIVKEINVQHLYSPAMWAVFPIQDLLGMDGDLRSPHTHAEQINVPANPRHYWKYRFHLNVEELLEADAFNQMLAELVTQSGRSEAY